MLALFVVAGIVYVVVQATEGNKYSNAVAKQVLLEIPRTISVLGSMAMGTLLAAAVYLQAHPEPNTPSFGRFVLVGLGFWLMALIYAIGLKMLFGRKSNLHFDP